VVNFNRIYKSRVKELQDELLSNTNSYKSKISELQAELALRINTTYATTPHSCYKDQIISDLKVSYQIYYVVCQRSKIHVFFLSGTK
jgi:hypothetical protein